MSFSKEVRDELINHYSRQEHARKAELAALMMLGSRFLSRDAESGRYIYTDKRNDLKSKEDFTGGRKTYNGADGFEKGLSLDAVTSKPEDKRAFLRGAFLAAGTIADPEKEYHFEIITPDRESADFICTLFAAFDVETKVTERRKRFVAYIKDSEQISTALNVIEAHGALMRFENTRIEREIRGTVNRQSNCDAANIKKSVTASMKQIDDINLIAEQMGLDNVDPQIADICRVRLANPDATLEEIGLLLTPPVGKSGANHRFRKIAEMAEKLRA